MSDVDSVQSRQGSVVEENPTKGRAEGLRTWIMILVAGSVAGLAGWGAIAQFSETFQLSQELADISPPYSEEVGQRIETALRGVAFRNRALCLGLLGAVGGAVFGATTGLLARSRSTVCLGLAVGVAAGGAFGSAAGALGLLAGEAFDVTNAISNAAAARDEQSMWTLYRGMAIHATTWLLLGVGYGLAVGVLSRPRVRVLPTVLAASGAGALWGAAYPFLGAIAFPMDSPEQAVPSGAGLRVIWSLVGSLLIAAALGRLLNREPAAARKAGRE